MNLYAQDKKEFDYIGSKKCKTCHKEQYKKWSEAKHSTAYEVLKSEGAAAKATAAKVEDPLTSETCLSCHATGVGAKNVAKGFDMTKEGVGCEACHGPGSAYKKMGTMKSREESIAAGMIVPDANTCANCHKAEIVGHEVKKFDYKTEWAKIAHPVDPKKDRRKKKK
jgi:hypothetical protein